MREGVREVPNSPIPFAPYELDDPNPHLWTCPLCGVQMHRLYGRPPTTCPSCGQNPLRQGDPNDWGERRDSA